LNITIFKGAAEIYKHTEQSWIAGNWKNIVFSYTVPEEHAVWDSVNDNPIVEVTMKVKGDYQESNLIFVEGDPAVFALRLGDEGTVEFPIDDSSWSANFQAGIDEAPAEDTPGFSLVIASAAIAMAIFTNAKKPEEEL
jgi:hypothetical protein